jgi:hypothetical protein
MPEHDIYDLDAAFRALEQDIAGRSAPHGAGAAVHTARRRRRTTIGAVAAVAVLAVGGVALGQGIATHTDSVGPSQLPAPAPLNASSLSTATQGWVSDWRAPKNQSDGFSLEGAPPRCLDAFDGTAEKPATPDPDRSGGSLLVAENEASISTLAEWNGDHPDASTVGYAAVVASVDACAQATPDRDYTWAGGQGRSWTISTGGQETQHLWVARTDSAVGFLWTGGTAGPVPDEVDQRVTSALLSGLLSPDSFTDSGPTGGSASASASSDAMPQVSDEDFARAVRGWDSGWSLNGTKQVADGVPCLRNWASGAAVSGTNLGGNGDQEYTTFASVADAQDAADRMAQALAGCSGSYAVSRLVDDARSTVLVAAGPDVVWVAREGASVGVLLVPSAGTAPPETVSTDVGGLMLAAMDQPTHGTVSQGSSGTGPVASSSAAAPQG